MHTYLFVLSPPYCGSTVLWRLLATSPAASAHPTEGQSVDGVRHIMRDRKPWDPRKKFPWAEIKQKWENVWDMSKPVLLEKSPPNIVWALEIERIFKPSYFIVIMRDPYAFCEGRRRRHKGSHINESAEFWVTCANYQLRNMEKLTNVTHFTYEALADNPAAIKQQILSFLPDLQDIDTTLAFKARSISKPSKQTIRNLNQEKINLLSSADIESVNAVLERNKHLMEFFGYKFLRSDFRHSLRYLRATAALNTLNALENGKRFGARLLKRDQ
ncbi:MAG: sulfotransferase [Gammaproteobacteria bacterium]